MDDAALLGGMEEEWWALWSRSSRATAFQSPAWLLPWWRTFGRGRLATIALRRGGRLVALAPLAVDDADGACRTVRLVGSGNSDHLDLLAEDGCEDACAAAVLEQLDACRERWDLCDLHCLPRDSPLLSTRPPRGWIRDAGAAELRPVLRLGHGSGAPGDVPPAMWARARYYRRRAARMGALEVERATERTADAMLDTLFALHGARWGAREMPGVLADGDVRAFHHDAATCLAARGLLRLYVMRLDGRPIAALLAFADRRRVCYYIGGFDPAAERLSPGTMLIAHAIEEASRAGAREFDFLLGAEPYKYRWGARDRASWRLTLRHP
ncbi:MAG TPA: GNAT family N-acetyltransferase [Gemmatimonadaceae bacterium]|nr:GNAT family N-acetyltransferase [Gemmatimonadaceae bacterium]